ncbi:RCC1 domain-containing protein [Streptomyces sp. NPDC057411]|uniref:RCC1 domain-containing protein n=1 Tax=unclassified Streptomyces TaxID=2593676 RepID=UPI00363F37F0
MTYSPARIGAALAAALAAVLALSTPSPAGAPDPWVRAWGLNSAGQLGNGSLLDQSTPSSVTGLARDSVREIAGGGGNNGNPFAVAVLNDGTVQSWGSNSNGQLGDGTTVNRPFPAAVSGLSGVTDVAAGVNFAVAVRAGRVLAWGAAGAGQLGDGTVGDQATTRPVRVQSLSGVTDAASGCYHTVALRADGTVWTWGMNDEGQLGIGSTTNRSTPQRVPGLTDVVAVTAGCRHSLALTAQGTVKAWGRNVDGQLGDDSTTPRSSPVDVVHLQDVAAVFSGGYHNLALLDDGGVRAWGGNWAGQLGDGSTVKRTTPVPVTGLGEVRSLAGGYDHTLAVLADQSVTAWGDNRSGQLGDGTTDSSRGPVLALPPGSGTTRVTTSTVWRTSYAY